MQIELTSTTTTTVMEYQITKAEAFDTGYAPGKRLERMIPTHLIAVFEGSETVAHHVTLNGPVTKKDGTASVRTVSESWHRDCAFMNIWGQPLPDWALPYTAREVKG
jgi:hypothetical protein